MRIRSTKNEKRVRDKYSKYNRFVRFQMFLSHVTIGKNDECWEWEGSIGEDGYGLFNWPEKRITGAHKASYEFFIGRRHGKQVCHSCDNPICVNPNHLWLGTQSQNVFDMYMKGRGVSTLTLEKAEKIRRLYRKGKYTQRELAERFGVSQTSISELINEKYWIN